MLIEFILQALIRLFRIRPVVFNRFWTQLLYFSFLLLRVVIPLALVDSICFLNFLHYMLPKGGHKML
jgi:hypothetical protein